MRETTSTICAGTYETTRYRVARRCLVPASPGIDGMLMADDLIETWEYLSFSADYDHDPVWMRYVASSFTRLEAIELALKHEGSITPAPERK